MKKLLTGVTCALLLMASTGCSSGKQSQSNDNETRSSKVQKHKSNTKKKDKSKKKDSGKKTTADSKQQVQQSSSPNNNNQQAASSQPQQQTQGNQSTQQQNSNGISYDTNTLTGFLNTYGVSPVAYKVKNGMSPYDALKNTPDIMKTSGEMQTEYAMDHRLRGS